MSITRERKPVVACVNLTRTYEGGVTALKDLTLNIEPGMSFGLLGENGAGKSTLVRLIMGFILPTRGKLSVLGERKVSRAHARIGYLHERPYVELRFSAKKYLTYMARLSGLWSQQASSRIAEVLEMVDLSAAADEKLATYSKGMLQRLCIAQALLSDPEFLILDEPTGGLDPYSQWAVRQIIANLRKRGKTLLICSHYLAEVETLCDTVGILQRGTLIQHGAVRDLVATQNKVEILLREDQSAAELVVRLALQSYIQKAEGNLLRFATRDQQRVLAALVQAEIPIFSLHPVNQTLEEVYIATTHPDLEKTTLVSTSSSTSVDSQ